MSSIGAMRRVMLNRREIQDVCLAAKTPNLRIDLSSHDGSSKRQ